MMAWQRRNFAKCEYYEGFHTQQRRYTVSVERLGEEFVIRSLEGHLEYCLG